MKTIGIAATQLSRRTALGFDIASVLSWASDVSENEIRGIAVRRALEQKPGFSVDEVIVKIIKLDQRPSPEEPQPEPSKGGDASCGPNRESPLSKGGADVQPGRAADDEALETWLRNFCQVTYGASSDRARFDFGEVQSIVANALRYARTNTVQLNAIRPYLRHIGKSPVLIGPEGSPCTCGLDAVLNAEAER